MLEAVLNHVNLHARIPICGMISQYNQVHHLLKFNMSWFGSNSERAKSVSSTSIAVFLVGFFTMISHFYADLDRKRRGQESTEYGGKGSENGRVFGGFISGSV